MNIVALMGRLTADPELKTTNSGLSYCRFTLAVDRRFSKEKQADFISCVAWRQTAEFVSRYFSKGSQMALNGSIQTGSYTDNSGNKRYTTDVVVDNVYFTGKKSDNPSSEQGSRPSAAPSASRQQPAVPAYVSGDDEDFGVMDSDDDVYPF